MPGFRSRKELLLTITLLAIAIPGTLIDIVLLVDRAIYGRIGAEFSVTGSLEQWWLGLAAGPCTEWLLNVVAFVVLGVGMVGAVAVVCGLPAMALAYLVRKAERSG